MTHLFPAQAHTPMAQVTPFSCSGKESVAFPKTTKATILVMQQARAGFLLKCEGAMRLTELSFPSSFTSHEGRLTPEDNSRRRHSCVLKVGGTQLPFEANLRKKENVPYVHATATSSRPDQPVADTLLMAYLIPDDDGYIKEFLLMERAPRTKLTLLERTKSFSPRRTQPSFAIRGHSGQPIEIRCLTGPR